MTGHLQLTAPGNALQILAEDVSIDMMGYAIKHVGPGNSGLAVSFNAQNGSIENGFIISTTTFNGSSFTLGGFSIGIWAEDYCVNMTVRNVSIQGTRFDAIFLEGASVLIENVTVQTAAGNGIYVPAGVVKDCVVDSIGEFGITADTVTGSSVNNSVGTAITAKVVANSTAVSIGTSGAGISAEVVSASSGLTAGTHGITASSTVSGSFGRSTNTSPGANGIVSGGAVSSSQGVAAGGSGINAIVVDSSIGQSTGSSVLSLGIISTKVSGSLGTTAGGDGIYASWVTDSQGSSSGTHGIFSSGINAGTVRHSYGLASNLSGGHGINSSSLVEGSIGAALSSSIGRHGIHMDNGPNHSFGGLVASSVGSSEGGFGIHAHTVNSSRGTSSGTHENDSSGIRASFVGDSSGNATAASGGHGIWANHMVSGSYGDTTSQSSEMHGILCRSSNALDGSVNASRGIAAAGLGIHAAIVVSSNGRSNGSNGLNSSGISAGVVNASFGNASANNGGNGIDGQLVTGSFGQAASGAENGIGASLVTDSIGARTSSVGGKFGIKAKQANASRAENGKEIDEEFNMP